MTTGLFLIILRLKQIPTWHEFELSNFNNVLDTPGALKKNYRLIQFSIAKIKICLVSKDKV